jgi:lipopolysaccharide transport system permease protein
MLEKKTTYNLIIEPGRTEKNYWADLYRYRELFYILSWRDLKVRYKQTVVGVLWAFLRPLLTMVVFTIVFGKLAKMQPEGDVPYAIMVFAAMLPWQFFSNALTEASNSLIGNANLLSKVYFPRLIVPASSVITSFVDFLISFVLLLVLMAYYQYMPTWKILFLPIYIALSFLTAFGLGLYLTALNVKYRDFRYIIPFIVQFGLYISPVGFSSSVIPDKWKTLYYLNPMVSIIDGFRWCIIRDSTTDPLSIYALFSVLMSVIILLIAIRQFRKMEKTFADLI